MSDSDDIYDSESDGYDIHDPRTREHEAYKIAQDNAGRATRRFRHGDHVDDDKKDNDESEEDNDDSGEDSDDYGEGNNDPMRLQNAREARGWALE